MTIKHLVLSAFLFSTIAALAPVASAATTLATVNGKSITLEEFNEKYGENVKFFRAKTPGKMDVLNEMIKVELGIQEARKLGLDKDPKVIERMNGVLYQVLLEQKLGKEFEKIQITNADAKKYYDKNPEVRTSHIFVGVPPGATQQQEQDAYQRIKDILEKHVRGNKKQSFAELAQQHSEDRSAAQGGDMDYQTKDQLDPDYYAAAVKLGSSGNVSGIVRSQFGYHIIKLTAVRKWTDVDQAKIKRLAFEEQRAKIYENYLESLRKKASVSVNQNLLQK